jgi:transposase
VGNYTSDMRPVRCGYECSRQLIQDGHPSGVASTAHAPRRAGNRGKRNDPLDPVMTARLPRADELTRVCVPDCALGAMRDLIRARDVVGAFQGSYCDVAANTLVPVGSEPTARRRNLERNKFKLADPTTRTCSADYDDAARETAYDREFRLSPLSEAIDKAGDYGITVVSMKQDWKVVF